MPSGRRSSGRRAAIGESEPSMTRPVALVRWSECVATIAPGAEAFKRDLPDAEIHLLDAGHFALDEKNDEIATLILAFLAKH